MAQRILELTLVSASNLKDVNFFSNMEVYAVASLNGDPGTRQQTETDRDGETDPTWDKTLWFFVPPMVASGSYHHVHVLLRTERFFGEDRDVGEVFIPLADLLAGASAGTTPPRCASYQVRKVQCAKRCGVLNVSYRLGPVMVPLLPDTGRWGDPLPLRKWECPPQDVRMLPALWHAGGGVAATSVGTKNMRKNSSSALGFSARLLVGGGFERMLFGDMPSSNMGAHKSG